MTDQTATPEDITFEGGYAELKSITASITSDDVSVHEMFEGFRRGKGLERSLRAYLKDREGELAEIEQGHNLPQFNIVAPGTASPPAPSAPVSAEPELPADTDDFAPADPGDFIPPDTGDFAPGPGPVEPSGGGSDDDIPF